MKQIDRKDLAKSLAILAIIAVWVGACSNNALSIKLPDPAPVVFPEIVKNGAISNPQSDGLVTKVYAPKTISLSVSKPKESSTVTLPEMDEKTLKGLVSYCQEFTSGGKLSYLLMPADIVSVSLNGDKVDVTVSDFSKLPYGDYLYPIVVDIDGVKSYHFIQVSKEGEFSPISDKLKKPLPANTFGGPVLDEPARMIAYVETNNWDPRNIANFVLEQTKQPVFDYVVLFAANINWNAVDGKRYISFNDKLQPIVDNSEIYFKPFHERGIKVIMSLLPNHQGVGFANFQSYEEALDFAKEAKMWSEKAGIDGWDIDEEYAEYHKLPELKTNRESWMWFLRAMKEVNPSTIITLYDFGHSFYPEMTDESGKHPADYIDQSWSDYGVNSGSMAGIPNNRFGKLSIQATYGQLSEYNAENRAVSNLRGGYRNLMIFNIPGGDMRDGSAASALSGATRVFYGQNALFEGKYYPGPNDKQ